MTYEKINWSEDKAITPGRLDHMEGQYQESVDYTDSEIGNLETSLGNDIDEVESNLQSHVDDNTNPHDVTKEQVGLGNVKNEEQITGNENPVTIGEDAETNYENDTAVGSSAQAQRTDEKQPANTAFGHNAQAVGDHGASAFGSVAWASATISTALGAFSEVEHEGSTAVGFYSITDSSDQVMLGDSENTVRIPGTLSKASGSFVIDHPDPDKKDTHDLRHCFVESPTRGDNLYRYEVEATEDGETVELELPDYFKHLNENPQVWLSPVKHFGRAYGEVEGNTAYITCELAGKYNVLIIGTRKDESAKSWFDYRGVEKEKGVKWTSDDPETVNSRWTIEVDGEDWEVRRLFDSRQDGVKTERIDDHFRGYTATNRRKKLRIKDLDMEATDEDIAEKIRELK